MASPIFQENSQWKQERFKFQLNSEGKKFDKKPNNEYNEMATNKKHNVISYINNLIGPEKPLETREWKKKKRFPEQITYVKKETPPSMEKQSPLPETKSTVKSLSSNSLRLVLILF